MYFSIYRDKYSFSRVCDGKSSECMINVLFLGYHNALEKICMTIYRHKTKNPNPKKKSTGKNIFFTKVPRPEKRKKKYPPKIAKNCKRKIKVPFLGDQI
jgi:hypothetical protein